jgi:hypothetical protein
MRSASAGSLTSVEGETYNFMDVPHFSGKNRLADLSSCVSRYFSQMAGVVIYIFMEVPLFVAG